ncbi:MAG: hypothetical protein WCI02_04920 [Planctomycetota bacterium]
MRLDRRWVFLLLLLLPIVGCRGCNDAKDADAEADAKKKKKQRLAADELRALPFSTELVGNAIKPGHWYQTRHKLKANFSDESLTASLTIVDKSNAPVAAADSFETVNYQRNIALATGQEKAIELTVLHPMIRAANPDDSNSGSSVTSIFAKYSLRGLGTSVLEEAFPNKIMEGYQTNIVVLARNLSRYTFWRGLDCIVWPRSDDLQQNRIVPHRIVDIDETELSSNFPNQLATMTSISHVVINDISLNGMSQEQLLALKDWLHFGGTIIINGPDSVSSVETSFLKELAPLQDTRDGQWTEAEDTKLNDGWTIRISEGDRIPFASDRKLPMLQGTLNADSQWIPTLEGMVAERLVGQGRIVMTTFPMSDAAFVRWPSYSSLIHNAILRKPHLEPTLGLDAASLFAGTWKGTERNPVHNTRLRMWARDFDMSMALPEGNTDNGNGEIRIASHPANKSTSLAAWNPASVILNYAVLTLRQSSGINVPRVSTIMKLLLGYLIVLVPVNWAIFRMFNRVELAWLLAPVIAMTGAVVVASSVHLDVGFSRSQTSVGFLELHNGYPRGLLSNYHALYSSLSTNYSAVYKKGDGLVLPLAKTGDRQSKKEAQAIEYWNADESGTGLQRFPVLSNTTGLIQSEEVIELGGSIRWTIDERGLAFTAQSSAGIQFRDVGLIGISEDGKLMVGWLGSPQPGSTTQGKLKELTQNNRWLDEWDENPILKRPVGLRLSDGLRWSEQDLDEIYLGALLHTVATRYPLQRGEWIAVGWFGETLSALEITPTTAQNRNVALALMHVKASSLLDEVRPDVRIFPKKPEEEPESPLD